MKISDFTKGVNVGDYCKVHIFCVDRKIGLSSRLITESQKGEDVQKPHKPSSSSLYENSRQCIKTKKLFGTENPQTASVIKCFHTCKNY